jgi:hypothetical protein
MMARTHAAAVIAGLTALLAAVSAFAQESVTPPPGDPPAPRGDAEIDAAFQCPETLASDKDRRLALVDYFHWIQRLHPDWSVAKAVEFKKALLIRHQCADSLRDLADYSAREHR